MDLITSPTNEPDYLFKQFNWWNLHNSGEGQYIVFEDAGNHLKIWAVKSEESKSFVCYGDLLLKEAR